MWVHKFLLKRKQRIKIWGSASKWLTTKSGGPQGCVLTPILFAIYICNIPVDNYKIVRAAKFVDDICCYSTGECHTQIDDLNDRLNEIFKWSNRWGVDFNVKKSKMMTFFRNKSELPKFERLVKIGTKNVEKVTMYKYLGVTMNENLSFDEHVLNILKKSDNQMFVIQKISSKNSYGKR